MGSRTGIGLALATGLLLALPVGGASAANTLTVTTNADSGTGSLRQDIAVANPGDTIVIPAGIGQIAITTELVVNKNLTIQGAGSGRTSIDAQGMSRVFEVDGPAAVTISGLLMTDGKPLPVGSTAVGGDVDVRGARLTLSNSILTRGSADTTGLMSGGISEGGGIAADSASSLTLLNTTVSDDQAAAGASGDGFGGGVYDTGSLVIRGGAVDGDTASGSALVGGGIAFEPAGTGTATIENASVSQNILQGATGGDQFGGGIDLNGGGGATIANVTLANNQVKDNDTNVAAGVAEGGGISFRTTGTIVNATVTGNTVSANDPLASRPLALGGGVSVAGAVTVLNSTINANTATASGSMAVSAGGDLWTIAALHIKNSIVAHGAVTSGGQNCSTSPPGTIVSDGHNIEGLNDCGFHSAGDQVNTDPALRPLAQNGGPVQTMALEPGSLAIDAGTNSGCPATDARGVLRPAGAACDVGAFEVATPRASTGAASALSRSTALLNGTATNPDLTGGRVSFQFGRTAAYGSQTPAQGIAATTAGEPFSVGVAGLAQATTYHFREVITNAVGTSVGADRTFTTTRTPPRPSLKVTGNGLTFTLRCTSSVACRVTLMARSTEHLRNRKIVAVTSAVHRVSKRTVVVGAARLTIAAGRTRKVTLKLKRLGRRLESKFKKLPLIVTVTLAEPGRKTVTVRVFRRTLKPPGKHKLVKKH